MYGIVFAGLPESSFLRLLFYRRLAHPAGAALSRFFFETAFYHHQKNIPKREGGTLCRSPFTPARLAATPLGREPTLPPSCSYFPKESAMNLKVNNFFERSERSERSGSIGRTEEECERRRREKKGEADRGGTARRPGG